jgi:hypothetical protein
VVVEVVIAQISSTGTSAGGAGGGGAGGDGGVPPHKQESGTTNTGVAVVEVVEAISRSRCVNGGSGIVIIRYKIQ